VSVSLIIPVCNNGEYLDECLDSVISQTLENIEIICIKSRSTDNSSNILASYKKANVHLTVIDHKENLDQSAARNIGLEHARGEYVFFLDPDDLLLSDDSLKHLYDIALRDKADEVIGATLNLYDESGERLLEYHKDYLKNNLKGVRFQDHLRHNTISFNKLFNRSFVADRNIQFNADLGTFADTVFSWKIHLLAYSISLTRQATYLHRICSVPDNKTDLNDKKKDVDYHVLVSSNMIDFFDQMQELSPLRHIFDLYFFSWCHKDVQELDLHNLSKLQKKEFLEKYLSVFSRIPVSSLTESNLPDRYVKGLSLMHKGEFEDAWDVFAAKSYQALCLKKQLDTVYNSLSWKLTSPLRKIKQRIKFIIK